MSEIMLQRTERPRRAAGSQKLVGPHPHVSGTGTPVHGRNRPAGAAAHAVQREAQCLGGGWLNPGACGFLPAGSCCHSSGWKEFPEPGGSCFYLCRYQGLFWKLCWGEEDNIIRM